MAFIRDINNPARGAESTSTIPIMYDVMSVAGEYDPNHPFPLGGNVLYMDGHVEFVKHPNKSSRAPYTIPLVNWTRLALRREYMVGRSPR